MYIFLKDSPIRDSPIKEATLDILSKHFLYLREINNRHPVK